MDFLTLRNNCPYWSDYTQHAFVTQLGRGTLPLDSFQHYLRQDFLFLLQFSRAWGVAIYKSNSLEKMRHAQIGLDAMLNVEIQSHLNYCQNWQLSPQEVANTQESSACVAYTRYVLDIGIQGTLAELYVALSPCIIGYAEIGKQLNIKSVLNNPYQSWIDLYSSTEYQQSALQTQTVIDMLCDTANTEQAKQLQQVFNTATRMEVAFWQMGLDRSL